jgi:hypothetical protein
MTLTSTNPSAKDPKTTRRELTALVQIVALGNVKIGATIAAIMIKVRIFAGISTAAAVASAIAAF